MKAADRHSRKNNLMTALLCVMTLAACSAQTTHKPAGTPTASDAGKTGEKIKPLETIAPLPTPMETFRALAPPTGLTIKPLFAGPVPDTDARMKRLEDSVQALRTDFDTVVPSLVRMVSMEKDIKELIKQLQKLTGETPAPEANMEQGEPVSNETLNEAAVSDHKAATEMGPPAPAKADALVPADAQEPPEAPPPPSVEPQAGSPAAGAAQPVEGNVEAVRIGDHGDTVRIVLDMTSQPAYTTALQNDGTRLVVEVWDMAWTAAPKQTLPGKTRVSGYSYENGKVFFDLTAPSRIVTQKILPGDDGKGGKLVIDLGKAEK
jgi:hypothetical protein